MNKNRMKVWDTCHGPWVIGAVVLGCGSALSFFAVPQFERLLREMCDSPPLPVLTNVIIHHPVILLLTVWLPLAILIGFLYRRSGSINRVVRCTVAYGLVTVLLLSYGLAFAVPLFDLLHVCCPCGS